MENCCRSNSPLFSTMMSKSRISLNYYDLWDSGNLFTIKIPRTNNVTILKDLIKEKNTQLLAHIDAKDLNLFQVRWANSRLNTLELSKVSLSDDRITLGLKIEDLEDPRQLCCWREKGFSWVSPELMFFRLFQLFVESVVNNAINYNPKVRLKQANLPLHRPYKMLRW